MGVFIFSECPWGQVPVVEHNGKMYCQSLAIVRFLAKRFNLMGADEYEAYKCDEIYEALRELMDGTICVSD